MRLDSGRRQAPAPPLWPVTRLGYWTVGLGAALLVSLALAGILLGVGLRGDWLFVFPGLAVLGGALGALCTSVVAHLREHERSRSVFLSGLLGGLVLAALLGELAFVA